jgi:hypothetical protein
MGRVNSDTRFITGARLEGIIMFYQVAYRGKNNISKRHNAQNFPQVAVEIILFSWVVLPGSAVIPFKLLV